LKDLKKTKYLRKEIEAEKLLAKVRS